MNLLFQIRLNTGQIDTLAIDSDRVLIGSGAHCDIRLAIDQARLEHVRVDVVPQGVYATAMSFEPPPTINGVAFTQAPLPANAIVGVGQTQIQVQLVDGANPVNLRATKKKTSPALLFGLLLIGAGAVANLLISSDNSSKLTPIEPPSLWPDEAQRVCPRPAGPVARNFAYDTLTMAESKRERRAFYPQDGVGAVLDFEVSAACFRAAGEPASAAYCDEAARGLREEMTQDFRKFRERLRYHYIHEEWVSARYDVRNLLAFCDNVQGEYKEFLKNTARDISMRGGGQVKH
jgi:hypothetical protein